MIGPTPIYDSSSTIFYNDSYSFVMKCYDDKLVEGKASSAPENSGQSVCKEKGNLELNERKN